jgi:hypothetical protein
MKKKLTFMLAGTIVVASTAAFAHHGMSAYDFQRQITLKGTVTAFEFANPHVLLHFGVKDRGGKVIEWVAETGSPNMMRRGGWTKASVKPGDEITVSGHPAKDGSASMRFMKIVLANGQELDPASGFK